MMRKKIIAGNWKMHLTAEAARALVRSMFEMTIDQSRSQVVLFPPVVYLEAFASGMKKEGLYFGAQNCSGKPQGAFTGEISADMIGSVGAQFCLVGHSERRQYFHEHDADCNEKIKALLAQNITPVLCVGEPLNVRDLSKQNEFVEQQLAGSLAGLSSQEVAKLYIAYEPVWAIGTGQTATTLQAIDMHTFIREWLSLHFTPKSAELIPLLYGGSVNEQNAKDLLHAKNIDGVLVGGASLKPGSFASILSCV